MSRSDRASIVVSLVAIAVSAYSCSILPAAHASSQGGTPKLQVGKIYDAIYQCQRLAVNTDQGVAGVDACYAEVWVILEVGKDGWYRIGDLKAGAEWYVNLNKISAIREHVEKAESTSTPRDVDPGPRIQAELTMALMADDVYLIDVEVHFAHGDPIIEQFTEATGSFNGDTLRIDLSPDERITYAIKGAVNYSRVTRRKLEPEVKPGWE